MSEPTYNEDEEAIEYAGRRVNQARNTNQSYLDLSGLHLSGLPSLDNLPSLRILAISNTQVTDLSPLASLKSLQSLNLSNTPVSNIAPLAALTSLQWLDLSNTRVSNLSPLVDMTELITGVRTGNRYGLSFAGCPLEDPVLRSFANLENPERTIRTINYLREKVAYPHWNADSDNDGYSNRTLVMVVDDIVSNVELLKAKLVEENFDVITASNGPNALQTIRTALPDVVLLDVMMPGMDGFEVCRQIRKDSQIQNTAIIFVTALDHPSDREAGYAAGANYFMTKPVDYAVLIERIRELAGATASDILDQLRQDPLGASAVVTGNHIALVLDEDDGPTGDDNEARQAHKEAVRKAQVLSDDCRGIENYPGWKRLKESAELFLSEIDRPFSDLGKRSVTLWSLSVSLGSFLEQNREAKIGGASMVGKLEPNVERALLDLVLTTANFVRLFEAPKKYDAGLIDSFSPPSATEAAREIASNAFTRDVLVSEDAKVLTSVLGSTAIDGDQTRKAHGFGLKTVMNVVVTAFALLRGGAIKKATEKYVDDSALVEKLTNFMTQSESEVLKLYEGVAPDIREAIREQLERQRRQ
jgi:CheY-like chemotaxis protein